MIAEFSFLSNYLSIIAWKMGDTDDKTDALSPTMTFSDAANHCERHCDMATRAWGLGHPIIAFWLAQGPPVLPLTASETEFLCVDSGFSSALVLQFELRIERETWHWLYQVIAD